MNAGKPITKKSLFDNTSRLIMLAQVVAKTILITILIDADSADSAVPWHVYIHISSENGIIMKGPIVSQEKHS